MYKVILASSSPRRKELLKQIGLEFICIPSHLEEVISKTAPEEVVEELSRQKAEDIAESVSYPSVIIGADTVVALQNKIMGKPADTQEAYEMLQDLQGTEHRVYTGITVIIKGDCGELQRFSFVERTEVSVYPMTSAQIQEYIATGEPMDKAGAYAIQGIFAKYIKKINGDYNNVVGLPVGRLYQELRKRI